LDEDEPGSAAPAHVVPIPINGHGHAHGDGGLNLAKSVRSLRLRNGLSQRQLALRMSVPRTYVSKVENEKATPTLSSLERLSRALEVSVPDLLFSGEDHRQQSVRELMEDKFVAEIAPFVARLNPVQMTTILARVSDLTAQASRSRVVR
jgi:transcriptional regulator with XRE-family HTH domain